MIQKRWKLKQCDESQVSTLQLETGLHPVLSRLAVLRGIRNKASFDRFMTASFSDLHDPFLMKGMHEAVERIHRAVSEEERILIFGDYDVDGTTAVSVVYTFLDSFYKHIDFYIPNRFTEGYGVSKQGIDYAHRTGVKLIITLDCGIKSIDLVNYARELGIAVIICDHHTPDIELPDALAILNPKQTDCPYPYKELCGCGIGYKLISAYGARFGIDVKTINRQLDLVATAIAADIVPITGENRTLCMLGLHKANLKPSVPILALKKINNMTKPFTISDLVFIIAPRVNAAGRMDDARKAVQLFIESDIEQACALAQILQVDNNDRRAVDLTTSSEALAMLENNPEMAKRKSTVVYQPHWHKGVVGIVASRLIDHHYRPSIVLTQSNGKVTGSARSIKGFNMYEGLNRCSHLLENFGGHYFAAGLTLDEKNLPAFIALFEDVVSEIVPEELFIPEIEIDADLDLKLIDYDFFDTLNRFAPHGPENLKPIFRTRGVTDYRAYSSVVKDKHLRLTVNHMGSRAFSGIGFNLAEKIDLVKSGMPFDIVYHLEENEWNNEKSIQLKILDVQAGN
ncbi:MAG: single-stranded-DNA-specific exonuclease RecJ [Chitinophagaceae bacterium]|nr:single-stranded-DNA-specific exonuclease RecJ [Chitinophagaceae bacterium]